MIPVPTRATPRLWTPVLALAALLVPPAAAQSGAEPVEARYEAYVEAASAAESGDRDFAALSLEELMNLEVTVASRVQEGFLGAPASVYVITGDELRRSGFTTLPEAMRMVPGFFVANWYASSWDLTSRGFSAAFSNQVQVMIDGKMQDDATWKQAKVVVDLARLVASKDPDMASRYGF